jgi:hypothetical protein
MEADLHAIVCFLFELLNNFAHYTIISLDSIGPTSNRFTFPIIHIPNTLRLEVHPLRQCPASGRETRKSSPQCRLRTQNLRFWSCERIHGRRGHFESCRESRLYDRICSDAVVPSARDNVELRQLRQYSAFPPQF